MKVVMLLSIAALVACDYPAAQPEAPSDSYGAPVPDSTETGDTANAAPSAAQIDAFKSVFNFQPIYKGAFPPAAIPPVNFLSQYSFPSQFSFRYPFKSFSLPQTTLSTAPQNVFPPISQIVNPILGGSSQPAFPVNPSQVFPPQIFPPQVFPPSQVVSKPSQLFTSQIPKYNFNYAFPLYYNTFPYYNYFKTPTTLSFPSTTILASPGTAPKEPVKAPASEPLSTSYGAPCSTPAESSAPFEPAGPVESSAPFEPPQVSYPYEPAAPESPETTPHKPAQEYGVPSKK